MSAVVTATIAYAVASVSAIAFASVMPGVVRPSRP